MRILYVLTEYVTEPNSFDGGIANHFYKYSVGLNAMGHEAVVIVRSDRDEKITHEGVEVHRVSLKRNQWYKFFDKLTRFRFQNTLDMIFLSWQLKQKVKEIHKEKRVDLAHYCSNRGYALLYYKKIPTVLLGANYEKFVNIANGLKNKGLIGRQMDILEGMVYKKHKNILVPSFWLKGVLKKELGVDSTLIETPFLKKEVERDSSLYDEIVQKTDGKPYLLYFGRMGVWKGVADIADALHEILSLERNYHFVFIGKNKGYKEGSIRDYIYAKAESFGERVHCFDNVPHSLLFPVIKGAAAIILPSRVENLSNASIETMSMGKILIGTRGASFDQLITDNENGFLCEIQDPRSIVDSVDRFSNLNEVEVEKMCKLARARTEKMSPDVILPELIDYYKKVISSK
jgi:glycosyltransferase involved in cell wall biosynthesis